jgi:hypothetical protein
MPCRFPYDDIPIGEMPGDLEDRQYDADIKVDIHFGMYVNAVKETRGVSALSGKPGHSGDRPPLLRTFEPGKCERPDFIAGLFRRGHLSLLVAEPGLGKSVLIQRLMCDLSIGGPVFDGFCATRPTNTLLFCGEAGSASSAAFILLK